MGESSVHDRLFCRHQHSGCVHGYSETRSWSNVWKENTHTNMRTQIRSKLTFSCEFWIYSLRATLCGSDAICDLKWRIKCPRNFRPSPWILPKNQPSRFISTSEWSHNLQQNWSWLQWVKGESSVHDRLFCRHQYWGYVHFVLWN